MQTIEYKKAAAFISEYHHSHTVQFDTTEEDIISMINEFKARFAPEILKRLKDDEILPYIFLTADGNNDSLCYHLEFNTKLRKTFGSISGGSSYKYGLFQRQEDGKWMTGAPKNPEVLTDADALTLGKSIRDSIVSACELIEGKALSTVNDYEILDDELNALIGKYASYAWIQKYFNMVFPEKFIGWYVTDWLKHILFGLGINPSTKYYGMNGQLAIIKQASGLLSPHFQDICYEIFGEIRHFFRLGSSDGDKNYYDAWKNAGEIAVGWKKTGDLLDYLKSGAIDKDKLASALETEYYSGDKKTASRKAGEIKNFYETASSAVITVMDGSRLIGFVDQLSPYYYDGDTEMSHKKNGTWHSVFNDGDRLPEDEGLLTTCVEIKKAANLLYLYKMYYGTTRSDSVNNDNINNRPIRFATGLISEFPRNRILFGAPGTGKSFTLNKQKDQLIIHDTDSERVTFHPDYSYANFVGTYKPVPCLDENGKDTITYKYVPGPFMRVYVEALKNSRADVTRPFLLIIEEINRANVAAVFGDIFQLLDRDSNNVSEYPIHISEDARKFLADELGGDESQYKIMRIPDNMFIWATMNSADQGVFPMDTAFKRRWDFTYLGINDAEKEMDEAVRNREFVFGVGEYARLVTWNDIRKAINDELSSESYNINEDKLVGPYFISKAILSGSESTFMSVFKNKVLMYLFDDAVKQRRKTFFENCKDDKKGVRYSEICSLFDEKGVFIFPDDISAQFDKKPSNETEASAE